MTKITEFTEPFNKKVHNGQYLHGFIYEDVFDQTFFQCLKKHVKNIVALSSKQTFLTANTGFTIDNKKVNLSSNLHADREQNVIFDLTFDNEYYYQTVDTIKVWGKDKIKKTVSPIFQTVFNKVENLPPTKFNLDDWVLYRAHINYLPNLKYLGLHYDTNPLLTNTKTSKDARTNSITFYLENHKEGCGGEFWTINGFVYKPKQNSALLLTNGNKVLHGVTQNIDDEPRLAFTVRLLHKDDMYLPGHPSKWLYDVGGITL